MAEEKQNGKKSYLRNLVDFIVVQGQGREIHIDSIVASIDAPLDTVRTYLGRLSGIGLIERGSTPKFYVCRDVERLNNIKKWQDVDAAQTACVTHEEADPDPLGGLREMVENLDWLINEHVPTLEKEVKDLKSENKSMYDFLNKFTGQLKKAKEIRLAVCEREEEREAIVQ